MRLHDIRLGSGHSRLLGSLAVTAEDLALLDIMSQAAKPFMKNVAPLFDAESWRVPDITAVYTPWPSSASSDDGFAERLWFDCKPDNLEGRVLPFFSQFKELIRRLSAVCSEGPFVRLSEHTAFYNILKFPLMSNSFTRCQLLSQSEIAPALRSAANAVWCTNGMDHSHRMPLCDILSFTDNPRVVGDVTGKLHLWQQEILRMSSAEVTNSIIRCMALLQIVLDRKEVDDVSKVEDVHGIYTGLVALGHLEVDGLTASTHLHITRFFTHFHRIREDDTRKCHWHATDQVFAHAGLSRCLRVLTGDDRTFTSSVWPSLLAAAEKSPSTHDEIAEVMKIWTSAYRSRFLSWSGQDKTVIDREERLQEIQKWWSDQMIDAVFMDLLIALAVVPSHKKRKCSERLKTLPWDTTDGIALFRSLCEAVNFVKRVIPRNERPAVLGDLVGLPATDPVPHRQSFVDAELLECSENMVADVQTFAPGSATFALSLALFALFNCYWRNGYHYVQLVAFLVQSVKIRQKIHRLPADISVLLSPVATVHYDIHGLNDCDRWVLDQILETFANLGNVGTTAHIVYEQQRRSLYDPFRGDMVAFASLESSLKLLPGRDPATEARIQLAKTVLRTCDSLVDLSSLSRTRQTQELIRAKDAVATFNGAVTARTKLGIKSFRCRDPKFLHLQKNFSDARQNYICNFQTTVTEIMADFAKILGNRRNFEEHTEAIPPLPELLPPKKDLLPTVRVAEVVRVTKECPKGCAEKPSLSLPRGTTIPIYRVPYTVQNTQLRRAALNIGAIYVNSCKIK